MRQPNLNFAPQLGIAWDPYSNGKTVVRAGAGLYYENVIFNNVLFDRPLRLQNGAFLQTPLACHGGNAQAVPVTVGNYNRGSQSKVRIPLRSRIIAPTRLVRLHQPWLRFRIPIRRTLRSV